MNIYLTVLNTWMHGLSGTPLIENTISNLSKSNKQPKISPDFQHGLS